MGNTVRRFLNARSPLRLLEKGLHGGLGAGNLGLVLAGHGVGKSSFVVGVALDELLRSKPVLHVACDHTVQHVRDHYDTVFEDLAATTHLENPAVVRAELDRLRRIRAYPPSALDAKRLREALDLERELGVHPELIVCPALGPLAAVRTPWQRKHPRVPSWPMLSAYVFQSVRISGNTERR